MAMDASGGIGGQMWQEAMVSTIGQVIARSWQPGTFTERRKFTVARQRALQKMREFALAHPASYIAELIQAATANGATYIDVEVEGGEVVLSRVGGRFRPAAKGVGRAGRLKKR